MLHNCLGRYAEFFKQSELVVAMESVESATDSVTVGASLDSMAAIQDSLVSVVKQVADSIQAQVK